MPFANHRLLADKLAERLVLAVAGLGEFAGACCFLQSGACLRLQLWASKQGHASFAERWVLAVAAVGKQAGACCFCKSARVRGGGFGQVSGSMLLLRSGACLRLQLWASKQGHVSFAERRVLAVAGVGELAGACCFLQSGAC